MSRSGREVERAFEVLHHRVDGRAIACRQGRDLAQDRRFFGRERHGQVTETNLFRAVVGAFELDLEPEDLVERLQIAQEEFDGVDDRLHGVAGDVLPAEIDPQRAQQRQVDVIAPAHHVVEAPQLGLAEVVGGDQHEAAGRDREIAAGLAADQNAYVVAQELLTLVGIVDDREADRARGPDDALHRLVGRGVEGVAGLVVATDQDAGRARGERSHDDGARVRVHHLDAAGQADDAIRLDGLAPILVVDLAGAGGFHDGVRDQLVENGRQHGADRVRTFRQLRRERRPDGGGRRRDSHIRRALVPGARSIEENLILADAPERVGDGVSGRLHRGGAAAGERHRDGHAGLVAAALDIGEDLRHRTAGNGAMRDRGHRLGRLRQGDRGQGTLVIPGAKSIEHELALIDVAVDVGNGVSGGLHDGLARAATGERHLIGRAGHIALADRADVELAHRVRELAGIAGRADDPRRDGEELRRLEERPHPRLIGA